MNRLASSLWWDIQIQWRNGFYAAAGFVLVILVLLLGQLPAGFLHPFSALLILGNLLLNTFYFTAALLMLERAEGSLWAWLITPLRWSEYVAAKVGSLLLLTLLENSLLAGWLWGSQLNWLYFWAGVSTAGWLLCAAGLFLCSYYHQVNEFLFPSFVLTALLCLPMASSAGLVPPLWVAWHPLFGPLTLLEIGCGLTPAVALFPAGLLTLFWSVAAWWLVQKAYQRMKDEL